MISEPWAFDIEWVKIGIKSSDIARFFIAQT